MNSLKPLLALASSAAILLSATAASGATLYTATRLPGHISSMAYVSAFGSMSYLRQSFDLNDQGQAFYQIGMLSAEPRLTYMWDPEAGGTLLGTSSTSFNLRPGVPQSIEMYHELLQISEPILSRSMSVPSFLPVDYYSWNNQRQIVGQVAWTATLWENGQVYDLNELAGFNQTITHSLYGTTDYRLRAATAINAQGQILAIASGAMYPSVPGDIYLLTPKGPEPKIEEIATTTPIPDHGINPLFWLLGLVVGSWCKRGHKESTLGGN